MAQEARFPIQLNNAFFITLEFHRTPELPDAIEIQFSVEARVHGKDFPDKLQIHLKVEAVENQPLTLFMELVGLFELVDGAPRPDHSALPDFVNERALYMLWPHVVQMVRQVTAQMGMNPVHFPTPYNFDFRLSNEIIESEQGEGG